MSTFSKVRNENENKTNQKNDLQTDWTNRIGQQWLNKTQMFWGVNNFLLGKESYTKNTNI